MGKNRLIDLFRNNRSFRLVLLFILLLILMLNGLTKKIADDFIYTQSSGLADIFAREFEQYMTWSGRSVAHFMDRISLALPRFLFIIANSFVFVFLLILTALHAYDNKRDIPFLTALAGCLVFCFAPMFGETVLWQTGSFNYLWTTVIILLFILPFTDSLREDTKRPAFFPVLMFFGGIIAGWTNENTAGAMVLCILGMTAFLLYEKRRPAVWMTAGIAGALIGLVLMVKAPGNSVRMLSFPDHSGLSSLLISAYEASLVISGPGDSGMRILWFFFAGAVTLAGIFEKDRKKLLKPLLFAFCSFAAVFAMVLSPVYINYSRSIFGSCIFLTAGIVSCCSLILTSGKADALLKAGLGILTVFSAMNYITAFIDLANTRYQFRNADRYITAQKEAGNLNPVIFAVNRDIMTKYDPLYDLEGLQGDWTHWVNTNFAAVAGLESICSTSGDIWTAVYMDGDPGLMNIVSMEAYLDALKREGRYCFTLTSTDLSSSRYDKIREELSAFFKEPVGSPYVMAVRDPSGITLKQSKEELYGEWDMDGHYMYLSSMGDPVRSDIVFDAVSLSNKNEGITITVYDPARGKIVDEISWQPDTTEHGMRCSREQYGKRG